MAAAATLAAMDQTFEIAEADAGVPSVATCQECGDTWHRPDDDEHADTLATWARDHLHPELPV